MLNILSFYLDYYYVIDRHKFSDTHFVPEVGPVKMIRSVQSSPLCEEMLKFRGDFIPSSRRKRQCAAKL